MSQYRKSRNGSRRNFNGSRNNSRRPQQSRRGPKKENIHPSRFVQAAKPPQKQEDYVPKHAFEDFAVTNTLKEAIAAREFREPSPIQDQIIPYGIDGHDVLGIANTGTGKTMAFAIPLLHHLMTNRDAKAIVIAPTRELAAQVLAECKTLIGDAKIRWALLIGGTPMRPQLKDLARRPNLVIGTPGRIKDHIERGNLKTRYYNIVALDEVDRMLDMGFVKDIRSILSGMPDQRQSYFFSATIDQRVRRIIDEFSRDAVEVSVRTSDTSENVEQGVVHYESNSHKIELLGDMLKQKHVEKALVFDDTRRQVEQLSKSLSAQGIATETMHGGRSQGQRKRALRNFKESQTKVLVATDVAARGIDVSDITHVINYSTPQTYDDYIHRIGRAGRAGRMGYATTFLPAKR